MAKKKTMSKKQKTTTNQKKKTARKTKSKSEHGESLDLVLIPNLDAFQKSIDLVNNIPDVTSGLKKALEGWRQPYQDLHNITAGLINLQSHFGSVIDPFRSIRESMDQINRLFNPDLSIIARQTSWMRQVHVELTPSFPNLKEQFEPKFYRAYASGISEAIKAFENLNATHLKTPSTVIQLPQEVIRLPSRESLMITHAAILVNADDLKETTAETFDEEITEFQAEVQDGIEAGISDLDPGLLKMLAGAEAALKSNNPDRVRHAMTSLRELITHILHKLAPDDRITGWTQEPSKFSNGRPTRRTRLEYIGRNINSGPLTDFMAADIKATLNFIQVFQGGTHAIDSKLGEEQAWAVYYKACSWIYFKLRISRL